MNKTARRQSNRSTPKGKREYLTERAYKELREQIMTGVFPPGEHLKEEALVAKLKVSRSIVRQALVRLTAEGLLEDQPKKGKSVVLFTEEKIAQLLPIRIALETLALQEAIQRMTPEDEAQLVFIAEQLKQPELHPSEQNALDVALHRKIWQIANNEELERILSRIVGPFHMMGNAIFTSPYYRRSVLGISLQTLLYERENSPAGHQPLIESLCNRNIGKAAHAMQEHLTYNYSASSVEFEREVGRLTRKYLHTTATAST